MKKLLLLLLFIPLVSFFYFFVSGFKVSPDKTQMSSDPDLKGYFVDSKNGDDENNDGSPSAPFLCETTWALHLCLSACLSQLRTHPLLRVCRHNDRRESFSGNSGALVETFLCGRGAVK